MPASERWQQTSALDDLRSGIPQSVIFDQGNQKVDSVTGAEIYKVGIYGWRKRCLYFFILLLTVIIVINLALTVWILSVFDFTSTGMGALKVTSDGIRVTGKAQFDKNPDFMQVSTAHGVPLSIDSDSGGGMYVKALNTSGKLNSQLSLSPDGRIDVECDRFEVHNADREMLFFASKNEVGIRVPNLKYIDETGAVFDGSIKTNKIKPISHEPLRLESSTRGIIVDASQNIVIKTSAGDITTTSLLDTRFEAKKGNISFSSRDIFVDGLLELERPGGEQQDQICICTVDGRLFVISPDQKCEDATRDICPEP